MLCVEFPQVQYIDSSELIHVLKAVAHDIKWALKRTGQSSVSHFLIAKVFPECRLNLGFGTQKKCPFPLNRGVPSIECFHMTSRRPYWCPKTMKRRPCWCPKPVLWELHSFLMQTLSFVPIYLHRCWPREWKHSIEVTDTKMWTFFCDQILCLLKGDVHWIGLSQRGVPIRYLHL